MSRTVRSATEVFSETADDYVATMVPALRPVAGEVVRRALIVPGERVLDAGTGTGIAAAAATEAGGNVIGVDAAPGMLAIARSDVAGAAFLEADFTRLPFDDAAFDVVIAAHALLFAADRVTALAEWWRVVRPGGRLSISVPGPDALTPSVVFGELYARYGIDPTGDYPTLDELGAWGAAAGWRVTDLAADPTVAIRLADDASFVRWRRIGSRGAATSTWSEDQRQALDRDMLAAAPRLPDGTISIPFGAQFLTAEHPG
jgi:SAM-dependent methyltransferase